MESSNFMQIVPDNQFYDSLDQIKYAVQRLATKLYQRNEIEEFEDCKYLIKGIENTSKKYKLKYDEQQSKEAI